MSRYYLRLFCFVPNVFLLWRWPVCAPQLYTTRYPRENRAKTAHVHYFTKFLSNWLYYEFCFNASFPSTYEDSLNSIRVLFIRPPSSVYIYEMHWSSPKCIYRFSMQPWTYCWNGLYSDPRAGKYKCLQTKTTWYLIMTHNIKSVPITLYFSGLRAYPRVSTCCLQ